MMKDTANLHASTDENEIEVLTDEDEVEVLTDDDIIYPTDSTSIVEIEFAIDKTKELISNPEIEKNVDNYLSNMANIENSEINAKIAEGTELAKRYSIEINKAKFSIEGTYFAYAVKLGKIFNALKILVNKVNLKWGPWATTNLTSINERTRSNYMLLASNVDIHPYGYLGIDRTLHVLHALKDFKGEDRFSKFLSKYNIEVNPEEEGSLEIFKSKVDAALANEKLSKLGVNVNFEKVENAIAIGIKFDRDRLKYMDRLTRDKGSAETHLDNLIINQGHEVDGFVNEKRLLNFSKLIVRMERSIDEILSNTDLLKDVDPDKLISLEDKINKLKLVCSNN